MEANRKKQLCEIYLDHFQEIYKRSGPDLTEHIRSTANQYKDQIAKSYLKIQRSTEEGKRLFNGDSINDDLENWINDLFIVRKSEEAILQHIHTHLAAGERYVRINMPSHLLNLGSRLLKMELCHYAIGEDCNGKDARDIYTQVSMIVDTCTSITMEAYMNDKLVMERRSQALQNHILGSELAETCQNIRAEMHDWHTTLLNIMLKPNPITPEDLPAITDSQFALWVRHKANVFFKETEETVALTTEIQSIDDKFEALLKFKNQGNREQLLSVIDDINSHVKKMSWLLQCLTERAHALDSGRDPLTKLYNRRYLDVILQKETMLAIRNSTPYIVLMIDIDNFKQINDNHGHQAGDKVIETTANFLYESVRASDYVFRYGGDEFLMLLIDTEEKRAGELAHEIIKKINSGGIISEDDQKIDIGISIGIALFKDSLDYHSIIKRADGALLQAKQNGKNNFAIA